VRAYAVAGVLVGAAMLALFGLAQALEVPVLADETPALGPAGAGAAAAGLALLTVDAVLPVPASGVMIANGALFGPVGGAVLSVAGSEAAALLAFAIGRRGGGALERAFASGRRGRAAAALRERGALAVVLSRPVPVVAETVAILAGATGMPLRRVAAAAALGSVPPAVAYALAGATAVRSGAAASVFGGVLALTAAFWLADRARTR
jgi:uncharacterized membrane protein YdjX (TVP38/TMEM64 family)